MAVRWSGKKLLVLAGIVLAYVAVGITFMVLADRNIITSAGRDGIESVSVGDYAAVRSSFDAANSFFNSHLLREDGHIDLYYMLDSNATYDKSNYTNSEAVSYYLLLAAKSGDKAGFDRELDFVESKMLQPHFGYMMWKLSPDDNASGDGTNIASDADLRAIHALLVAEKKWGDKRYSGLIDRLAAGLENVAITNDTYLAPYGGVSGENSTWVGKEVWLSYEDFVVFKALAARRGGPWQAVYDNSRAASLKSQIAVGLFNPELTEKREYGNGIDAGSYSINSMWMMVRMAESGDAGLMAAARKSLDFYKEKFELDGGRIYTSYSSNGDALSSYDSPWVYALVGRAAVALGDEAFSYRMVQKIAGFQVNDAASPDYGAIPESLDDSPRVGQFTMQESMLTLQAFLEKYG